MEHLTEQSEWENYDLSFFDGLNLYLAEKRIDYGKNDPAETGLVNTNGEWVYKCAKNEFIGLRHHFYGSKATEKSNRALRLFTITRDVGTQETPSYKTSLFTFEDEKLTALLPDLNIVKSEIISPERIVLDVLDPTEPQKLSVKIFDLQNKNLTEVITTTRFEDELLNNQLVSHPVSGDKFLFSVLIKIIESESYYALFDHDGNRLLNFDTTQGNYGESTWFELTKKGFGITYKDLPYPV